MGFTNDSTAQRYVRLRLRFYAYCVSLGLSVKEMKRATGKDTRTVYYAFEKDEFRNLVQQYTFL